MPTQILAVDSDRPQPEVMARAAAILQDGGLVAFPTETVYGLGANALSATAVRGIFVAKGRPATNPVIVHVASVNQARELTVEWTDAAEILADRFWPGPLTLVLRRAISIPDEVCAAGPTVALRFPLHPVARALIEAAQMPLAAPSANRSLRISPTRAEHVLRGLRDRIDLLLDGGPTPGGLESTVVDVTGKCVQLLRAGLITPHELRQALGQEVRAPDSDQPGEPSRSPGRLPRHYAPTIPLEVTCDDGRVRASHWLERGLRVGWLTFGPRAPLDHPRLRVVEMPTDPVEYGRRLYAQLHDLETSVDCVICELPPDRPEWLAVRDRLVRASAPEPQTMEPHSRPPALD